MNRVGSLRAVTRAGQTERRRLVAAGILGWGAVLGAGGLLLTSGYLISRAAQRPEILSLTVAIVAVRAFALVRAVCRYGERLTSHDAALRLLGRLRVRFYRRLAPLVPGDLGGPRAGDLLSRFVGDVDTLQDLYVRALAPPIVAALTIAAAGIAAWRLLPAAAPVLFCCLLAAALIVPAFTAALAAAAGRRQSPLRAALTNELVESIDGAAELAVAGRAAERIDRLHAADRRLASVGVRDAVAAGTATALGSLAAGLTVLAILLVAIPAVHAGTLAGVLLAAIVLLALASFEGIAPLPDAARRLWACAESADRLEQLCGRVAAVRDPEAPVPAPASGDLALRAVRFRYSPKEPWVLDGADLRLTPGCRIALIGPSGIGKTTIAQLLIRFRDVQAGAVALGGRDVRELRQDDLRRAVVLAAQDAHVFNTTVRENLLLARRDAEEIDLWRALAAAGAADWVRALPHGLDTRVGEDGGLLSGGQRQRLTLARVLLTDARFLVLDEPTAHLDEITARGVMRDLLAAAGERGVLVITHDAAQLDEFEEVLELDAGRLRPATTRLQPASFN